MSALSVLQSKVELVIAVENSICIHAKFLEKRCIDPPSSCKIEASASRLTSAVKSMGE